MMAKAPTSAAPLNAPRPAARPTQLADIPEEEIWLQKQKSARTRRAYRLDVQHFMKTLGITTAAELRQADHKAVIACEGQPSTNCGASSSAPSSPTSPAPSGSFGCSHWCSAIVG